MSSRASLVVDSRGKGLRRSSYTKTSLGVGSKDRGKFGYSRTSSIRSFLAISTFSKVDENATYNPGPPVLDNSLKIVNKILGYKSIMCCKVLKSRNVLTLGFSDGTIQFHDAKSGVVTNTLCLSEEFEVPVTCISFLNGFMISSYASGETKLYDMSSWNCTWSISEDRQTLANVVRSDNEVIALAGSDAKIQLYDVNSQKLIRTLESSGDEDVMDGHTMRVFTLKYHPVSKNILVSGSWDNSVLFWDDRQPHAFRNIFGPHICGEGIDFIDDGEKIVTASWRKHDSLELWSFSTGKLLRSLVPDSYSSFLYNCQYVPENNYLICGGGNNNMVRIVECNSWMTVGTYRNLPGSVYCVTDLVDPNSKRELVFCIGFAQCCYVLELAS